ncbi:helix-turn-helix transcriptional regulator [Mycobacteroides abscessus]|uniref:helix-turn-helix transcriptional regulator n=1 Tax=Mycobacteroides abscessus TaxID=36809 RepID=UPI0009A7F530|nr:helix-turn-helix transcriptional regulator [Mycobacteroides abscessus]
MRTLFDLIKDTLQEQGSSQEAFAQTLGVSRQTLRAWQSSVPGPALVRSVAQHLGVPYSQVLTAAFVSGGYLNSQTELLAGQSIHAIAYSDGPYWDRGQPATVAIFSEKADVERFIEASEYTDPGGEYVPAELVIDGKPIPPLFTVYETVWWYRSGIRQTEYQRGEIPANLHNKEVGQIIAAEMPSTPGIYELRVTSVTEASGRQAIEAARLELDTAGKLMDPAVELPPRPSSFAEMIPTFAALDAAERAGNPEAEPDPSQGDLVFPAAGEPGPQHVRLSPSPMPQQMGPAALASWAAANENAVRKTFPAAGALPFGLGIGQYEYRWTDPNKAPEPPKEVPRYFAIGTAGHADLKRREEASRLLGQNTPSIHLPEEDRYPDPHQPHPDDK